MARRRRRYRAFVTLLALLVLVGGGIYFAVSRLDVSRSLLRERCTAAVGSDSYELAPDQAANAALISAISLQRGMPARAASIALATALQESKLRNISYGHMDSLGLFQQRPSQGWGTTAQVTDPVHATNAFFDALAAVPGYQSMPITQAAQTVQRSAYPEAYGDHEPESRAYASALTGQSPAALNCWLRKATQPGDPAQVEAALGQDFGNYPVHATASTVTVDAADQAGWAVAQWAVANARNLNLETVSFAGLAWQRDGSGWAEAATTTGQVQITLSTGR